ncbi:MAG: aspartate kinase [Candidatus Aminicenantes bacterium]|nr:aspartate kinase [Candidatus Aminicenantes bacterium]
MKVMKFGGGCLKDAKTLDRVAAIIAHEGRKPAVVVSAFQGVTDQLIAAAAAARDDERTISDRVSRLWDRHVKVAEGAIRPVAVREETLRAIEVVLQRVERLLYGIAYTGEASPAIHNHVLSYGERLAARCVAGALRARGVAARPLDSDRIGMVTDDALENATVNLGRFRASFRRTAGHIKRGLYVPVVTGFFGVTPEGRISLFGRNGSDYSAAVLAHGLEARSLEIWKDVGGFMSADPDAVKAARKIGRLSYYEAAELSYFGAKILHPRTLEPLTGRTVEVRIKSLAEPGGRGTEIVRRVPARRNVVKSVTANEGLALLRIHGPGVGYKPGIIGRLGRRLAELRVNIYSIITAQTCINLLVDGKDARRGFEALKSDRNGVIARVDLEEDVALVAVVGEGMVERRGVAARVFSAVARAGVNVEMISSGASEVATYFIVDRADAARAVRALHREFFG